MNVPSNITNEVPAVASAYVSVDAGQPYPNNSTAAKSMGFKSGLRQLESPTKAI